VAQVLIAVGVDINAQSDRGFTPLYVATSVGAKRTAYLLREAGAVMEVPRRVTPGVRTCLDADVNRVPRAVDARANNLGRYPYLGEF